MKNISSFILGIAASVSLAVVLVFALPGVVVASDYGGSYYINYDNGYSFDYDYGYDDGYSFDYDYGYDSGYNFDYGYGYDDGYSFDYYYDDYSYDYGYDDGYSFDYYYDEYSYEYDYGYDYGYDDEPYYNQPYNDYQYVYDDYGYDYDYDYDWDYDYDYDYDWDYDYDYDYPDYDEPRCELEISDVTVDEGDYVTISWLTENADHVTLTGFGSVSRSGSERIRVYEDKSFTLRVEGRGGSDDCYVKVRVDEDREPPHNDDDLRCELTVEDKTIDEDESTTLRWDTEDATEVRINQGIGEVSRSGSMRISPNRDTTYTLTAEDNHGNEEDCTVTVRVDEEEEEDDLWCELKASPRSIEEGDRVRLTWDTRGDVTDARINHGVGSVDEDGGTEDVRPDRDTRYTLTIENRDGDEEECSATVDVDDGLAPPPDVPLVYLSQLPYTGAEDGPMYWILLITGSGLVGYMLFFRALPFAYARVKMLKSEDVAEATEAGEGEVAAPENVTRQDVRAFVSAVAEGDTAQAKEFARTHGAVLFAEAAVVLDDVVRARANGAKSDAVVADVTKTWDASKFETLIEAFANATDESAVEKALA